MTFDPSQFGATLATPSQSSAFDPSQFGATAVNDSPQSAPQPSFSDQLWSSLSNSGGSPIKAAASAIGSGFQNLANAPSEIANQFKAGVTQSKTGGTGAEDTLGKLSGIATAVSSPLAPVFKPLLEVIGDIGNRVGDSSTVQNFAASPAGEMTSRVATDVGNAANVAGAALGTVSAVKAIPDVITNVKDSLPNLSTDTAVNTDKSIVDNYTRAIKPTIVGKQNLPAIQKYQKNIVSAVNSIVANKDSLSFTDSAGQPETGRLPQSPMEFSQAIDQTKAGVFSQYDSLAKQAGEKGAFVDSTPIASSLNKVAGNEALRLTNPSAVKYANDFASRLVANPGEVPSGMSLSDYLDSEGNAPKYKQFDAPTTQEIIKSMNSNLEAFYKNPSYDNASKVAIDAGVVHQFREGLGDSIKSATGENYQAIKNQYAALSAIEKDVAKRAIVLARQQSVGSAAGLGKYMDVFSGGDMVQGLLTLNPALFAKGAAQTAFTRFFQYLNSPDRAIGNMFKAATPSANVQ